MERNFNPRSPCGERPRRRVRNGRRRGISIHAPRAGSDDDKIDNVACMIKFQSTLPVRGATVLCEVSRGKQRNFNPRSPCGERRGAFYGCTGLTISIHAPRAGSDDVFWKVYPRHTAFQSTLPVRERRRQKSMNGWRRHFNPRSPCGERLLTPQRAWWSKAFQSTLPVRGATAIISYAKCSRDISIHAPRAGSDLWCILLLWHGLHFNPRSPCGERHKQR